MSEIALKLVRAVDTKYFDKKLNRLILLKLKIFCLVIQN